MFSKILDYFRDEEDKDPVFIRLTRNIVIFVILTNAAVLPLVTGWVGENSLNPPAIVALTITLALECVSLFFISRENVLPAKALIPISLIVAITVISLNTNGLKNAAMMAMPLVLLISSTLLKWRSIFTSTPLAIIAVIIVAIFDLNGKIPFVKAGLDDAIILPVLLFGGARIIQATAGRLNESLKAARISEQMHKDENIELNELRAQLEERVNQRTADLDAANRFNQRRVRQFEAIAQVNRAITTTQHLDTLLPLITQVISEQFDVYHAGIFLLDEQREFAVLRAANSEGGRRMLGRGHKLEVGQAGIVGFATATGQPRIALDVGSDPVHFENPDLPQTHSEIALPLRYEGRIIGALDVQSAQPNAFGQGDIEILTTLADQVAAAINNTQVLENATKALEESKGAFEKTVQEAWKVMRPKTSGMGFQLADSTLTPLEQRLDGDHIREAVTKNTPARSAVAENAPPSIAIPIHLRGKVVGVINLRARNQRELTADDLDIAQAVTERLSLAIESATLLQSAQHRADIERITTQISARISSSTRFETILQTAAEELSKALSGSDVLVQLESTSMDMEMSS
jgi:GAF domain-containing protein